jgi:hypothetical protein
MLAVALTLSTVLAPAGYAQSQPPIRQERTKDRSYIKLGLGLFAASLAAVFLVAHGVRAAASKGKLPDATNEIKGRVVESSADSLTIVTGKGLQEQRRQFLITPQTRINKPPTVGVQIKVRFQKGQPAAVAGDPLIAFEIK